MQGKYPVITLCGSTRFKDQFMEAQKKLTLEGNIVISVGLFGHSGDSEVWENMDEGTLTKTKEMLDDIHKRKIDMSDEIFVINVGGYIGDSTRSEIEYALAHGKKVRYLEDPWEEETVDLVVKHFNELSTSELYEILKTRFEIFVTEQECLYQDLDDKDQDAIHVFCWNENGRVAGCLRVFMRDAENGIVQIGRVVTLEHGKGIGGQLLHRGVEVAVERFKAKKIYLEAQVYAIGYYAKEGFEVVSDEFMEDGIPHVKMEKVIKE